MTPGVRQAGVEDLGREPGASTARRAARFAVQLVGFAACIGLLWWVVRGVFAPGNRAQLERLREAPALHVTALLGLGLATLVVNGLIFQTAVRPVRRLGTADVQAVNAIASILAMLPFKLSVVFRVVMHHRRDRLPLLTIAAWFGAIAVTMAATVLPALGASLWRGTIDAAWWAASLGGIAVLSTLVIVGARLFSDGAGWSWLERTVRRLPLPTAIKGSADGAKTGVLPRVHEGLRMLAHPWTVLACVGLRILDAGVQSARFLVAAAILGVTLPPDKAVIAGTTYFLIGAAAPTGQLGAREAGTAGLLGTLMHGVDMDQFKLVVLLVTATETSGLLLCAMAGAAWLRPWRGAGMGRWADRERRG